MAPKRSLTIGRAAEAAIVLADPTVFGLLEPYAGWEGFARRVGTLWLALGVAGVLFRMLQLCFIQNVQAALSWGFKIITDPFVGQPKSFR